MNTTIWVDTATRDQLKARKERIGAASLDAVVRSLLKQTEPTTKEIFAERRQAIRRLCRDYGVNRLIAFGSRARGDARSDSDLDLAYELNPKRLKTFDLFDQMDLQDALEGAFGMPIDLVRLGAVNDRLAKHIRRDGVELVAPR